MGKHAGKPDPNENAGHGRDTYWKASASAKEKADNFDAYDKYATGNAKDDNPYSKENFNK